MKETYKPMEIDIQMLPEDDVITASEVATTSEHDNLFLCFDMFE